MKQLLTLYALLLLTASVFAQAPQKMSYQAVIRNSSNTLVTNANVGMKISILQGSTNGTVVYAETQIPSTNANGLVNLQIGSGTVLSGVFANIDWANGTYFIKTETDPTGGTNYTITGTSQLVSVPYALHAKTAESVTGGVNGTQVGDMQYWNGNTWTLVPATLNNGATLQMINGVPTWTGGTPPVLATLTTVAVTSITQTTATTGGNITSDGGAPITQRGVVWGTTANPTIANSKTTNGTGTGSFTSNLVGLTAGTLYYVRAYATNNIGTAYGDEVSFTTTAAVPTAPSVTSTTGKIWMDRNLGASQVAISSTDAAAYGDLYQWGRGTDGHEKRTSATTATLSTSDTPEHGDFITASFVPYDWRSSQSDNLWQGVNGVNNPCPSGYRVPTLAELEAERLTWSSNDAAGAFASPLKLPMAGGRNGNGSLYDVGSFGYYWCSTVNGTYSRDLTFYYGYAAAYSIGRAIGFSVRCIKD